MAGATAYWKIKEHNMASTNNKTDRFRPDVTEGGTVDALSLPQHDVNKDVQAEQKHQVVLVTQQVIKEACVESVVETMKKETKTQ